jgi:hypothetical protein
MDGITLIGTATVIVRLGSSWCSPIRISCIAASGHTSAGGFGHGDLLSRQFSQPTCRRLMPCCFHICMAITSIG